MDDKIINVSPSRLKTWETCKRQYFYKYKSKLPDPSKPKTRVGSMIHEILECVSTPAKFERRKAYILYAIETRTNHPVILRSLKKLCKKFEIPEGDLVEYAHKLMLDTFTKGYDIHCPVVAVEQEFHIKVSDKVYLKGFIDKIVEIDEETLETVDYKSGVPFNEEKCQTEFQPYFYKIAAQKLFPKYKNHIFSFHFLKNKKIITVVKTQDELDRFLKYIISQGILMLTITEETAIVTKSWSCQHMCAFKDPKPELGHMGCPAFYDKQGKSLWTQQSWKIH